MLGLAILLSLLSVDQAPASAPTSDQASSDSIFSIMEEQEVASLPDIFAVLEEEKTVSAGVTRATPLREAPSSLWVLSSFTLQSTPMLSLSDALRLIPGVITREYGLGQVENSLRFVGSFPDNQALIVIDGRSAIAEGVGVFDKQMLNVQDIERVEVVLGPASTLYGFNAFSGVISITTRKPSTQGFRVHVIGSGGGATGMTNVEPSPALQIGVLADGYGEMSYGWGSGGFKLSLGGSYMPGFGHRGDAGRIATEPNKRVAATFDLVQKVNAWDLRLQLSGASKKSEYEVVDASATSYQEINAHFSAERTGLLGEADQLSLHAHARFLSVRAQPLVGVDEPVYVPMDTTTIELRAQYALPVFAKNAITVGAQFRSSIADSPILRADGRTMLSAGIFVEDTFRPINELVLSAGLRVDDREFIGTAPFHYLNLSPRASVVYLPSDNHALRLEYSSAVRTPTAIERAGEIRSSVSNQTIFVGDPNLNNERVHAWSLAWLGKFDWFRPRVEVYLSRTLQNGAVNFTPVGGDETEFRGQSLYVPELGGRFKLPFVSHNLDGFWIPGGVVRLDFEPSRVWRGWAQYTFYPTDSMHTVGIGQELVLARAIITTQIYFQDQWTDDPTRPFDIAGRIIVNAKLRFPLEEKNRFWFSVSGMNLVDVRFFRFHRTGVEALSGDVSTGSRLGPRVFASIEYHFDPQGDQQ